MEFCMQSRKRYNETERGKSPMRKTLSALLIAALLALTAVCALAVQAEEDAIETGGEPEPAVIYNFLTELTDTDTEQYTLKTNSNGSVTITLKQNASQAAPITIMEEFTNNEFDASKQVYLAADIVCNNQEIDFRLHYTRNDKLADQFWTGMRTDANAKWTASKTDTSVVWNVTKYLTDNSKLNPDNKHKYTDLMITDGKNGDVLTFNTLALISEPTALVPGTPLVGGAEDNSTTTSDETTSDETASDVTTSDETASDVTTSDETTPAETSSEASVSSESSESSVSSESPTSSVSSTSSATGSTSSGPVPTGDAGVILYVVFAVLAAFGAIAMVRLRQE